MDAKGVSTDPHEAPMPLKAMPKLVRLEGRSFPRNRNKEDSFLQSKLKDDIDGPSKLYNDSEFQRKPHRRTHEQASSLSDTPVDNALTVAQHSTVKRRTVEFICFLW